METYNYYVLDPSDGHESIEDIGVVSTFLNTVHLSEYNYDTTLASLVKANTRHFVLVLDDYFMIVNPTTTQSIKSMKVYLRYLLLSIFRSQSIKSVDIMFDHMKSGMGINCDEYYEPKAIPILSFMTQRMYDKLKKEDQISDPPYFTSINRIVSSVSDGYSNECEQVLSNHTVSKHFFFVYEDDWIVVLDPTNPTSNFFRCAHRFEDKLLTHSKTGLDFKMYQNEANTCGGCWLDEVRYTVFLTPGTSKFEYIEDEMVVELSKFNYIGIDSNYNIADLHAQNSVVPYSSSHFIVLDKDECTFYEPGDEYDGNCEESGDEDSKDGEVKKTDIEYYCYVVERGEEQGVLSEVDFNLWPLSKFDNVGYILKSNAE